MSEKQSFKQLAIATSGLTSEQLQRRCLMFSYGSNMLHKQVVQRTPSAVKVAVGSLENYSLTFVGRGVATANVAAGKKLPGIIWSVELGDLLVMHEYEGFPYVYDCKLKPINTIDGEVKQAWTYIHTSENITKPGDDYLLKILIGAEEAGIPDSYIWDAYEHAVKVHTKMAWMQKIKEAEELELAAKRKDKTEKEDWVWELPSQPQTRERKQTPRTSYEFWERTEDEKRHSRKKDWSYILSEKWDDVF